MNYDLNSVLQRLAVLRLSIASVWLLFLAYLHHQHFSQLTPAWVLLALYIPLLLVNRWHGQQQNIKEWHLLLHLAFEAQLLAGLVFFTGGATNPFISYFLILLVFASYSLSGWMMFWVAVLCIADYSALTQWYQPLHSGHSHDISGNSLLDWHLAGMWLTFVISALIVITLIPMLLRSRQRQQQEIQHLRERQLKNEQLIGIATLAAGTAHEMGTPLMTMHMILDDIAQQPDHPLTKQDLQLLREQVSSCRNSLQHLANSGRNAHQVGHQDAYQWLCNLLRRWRLSHPNALWVDEGIDQQAQIPASPLLDQALLNLLDNAAEAGQQPIHLTAGISDHHWQLEILQPDSQAASQINKHGLFNSQKEHGMGIGLYLSNASVEQFGGSVHLAAQQSGASLCRVRLPIHSQAKPESSSQFSPVTE